MNGLTIVQPGMFTTVQDLGRAGHHHLGIATSGAADTLSLRIGNRLVGNHDNAAALEFTLLGGTLRCASNVLVALTGAPLVASYAAPGGGTEALPRASAIHLRAGTTLRLGGSPWGVRAYLCVHGGIDMPVVLGSRSTHATSQLGGLDGRTLRAGDHLPLARAQPHAYARALPPATLAALDAMQRTPTLRATDTAHTSSFTAAARSQFFSAPWHVTDRCDRAGIRLQGPAIVPPGGGKLASQGLPLGAVEIPSAGEAIILLGDGPPTGGYPTLCCVASVDHPRLGQLRPRESISFMHISFAEARALFAAQQAWLDRAVPRPSGTDP